MRYKKDPKRNVQRQTKQEKKTSLIDSAAQ